MGELPISTNDLLQWLTKAAMVVGLVWSVLQARSAREKQIRADEKWRTEIELTNRNRDELYDVEIKALRTEIERHEREDNRVAAALEKIGTRLTRIETILEHEKRAAELPDKHRST